MDLSEQRQVEQLLLSVDHELVIDNFAGGGGTSEGLERAFGRPVDIAINHDPEALAMHAINHPKTLHLCTSVWNVDPIEVTGGRPVALVWLSPDCKHFSKAKGGTPVSKNIRDLAWVGLRWLALTKPRLIIYENVEEFQDWGDLIVDAHGKARPDPSKKGKTFASFVRQHQALGYTVEYRVLKASSDGAPTIRKRLFVVCRRDGQPIAWPEATHGDPLSPSVLAGALRPWRTAAECIDFGAPVRSIFGRARPLVDNTLRRTAKGLWRHVLSSDRPFVVSLESGLTSGVSTALDRADGPHAAPFLTEHAQASNQRTMSVDEPLRTVCAQVKGGHFSVVAPVLAPLRGTSLGHMQGHSVRAPLSTVTASGTHHGLVGAHMVTIGYGERPGQDARTNDAREPLGTVVAGGVKQAVAEARLHNLDLGLVVPLAGEFEAGGSHSGSLARPAQRMITAYCIKYYSNGGQWQGVGEPMHTLPTKGRMGLVQTVQVPASRLDATHLARARECADLLRRYLPEIFAEEGDVVVWWFRGQWWALVDITLRMLKPRELFRAQGFPESYVIDEIPDPALLFHGGRQAADPMSVPRVRLSTSAQVRMVGNSVVPVMAERLVRANFAGQGQALPVAA